RLRRQADRGAASMHEVGHDRRKERGKEQRNGDDRGSSSTNAVGPLNSDHSWPHAGHSTAPPSSTVSGSTGTRQRGQAGGGMCGDPPAPANNEPQTIGATLVMQAVP